MGEAVCVVATLDERQLRQAMDDHGEVIGYYTKNRRRKSEKQLRFFLASTPDEHGEANLSTYD